MHSHSVRLQNVLADRGIASRRAAAGIINAGRVSVNGAVVLQPGARVDPRRDAVIVDGKRIPQERERLRTILLNKPRGYVCSVSSNEGRSVMELVRGVRERVVPVGRLDVQSEGVLLLSNDGDLVNLLTHPRYGKTKVYEVAVDGPVSREALRALRAPILIDGRTAAPARVRVVDQANADGPVILEFTLSEGRNRQIRKLCEEAGLKVRRLVRTSFDGLACLDLKPGRWRDLTSRELAALGRTRHNAPSPGARAAAPPGLSPPRQGRAAPSP